MPGYSGNSERERLGARSFSSELQAELERYLRPVETFPRKLVCFRHRRKKLFCLTVATRSV
jgi:hypothetical protein